MLNNLNVYVQCYQTVRNSDVVYVVRGVCSQTMTSSMLAVAENSKRCLYYTRRSSTDRIT